MPINISDPQGILKEALEKGNPILKKYIAALEEQVERYEKALDRMTEMLKPTLCVIKSNATINQE